MLSSPKDSLARLHTLEKKGREFAKEWTRDIEHVFLDMGGTLIDNTGYGTFVKTNDVDQRLKLVEPTAIETMMILRDRGYKLGIVSNTVEDSMRTMEAIVAAFGSGIFHSVTLSSDPHVMSSKPDQDIYKISIVKHSSRSSEDKKRLVEPAGRKILFVGNDYHNDVVVPKTIFDMKTAYLSHNDVTGNARSARESSYKHVDIQLNRISDLLKHLHGRSE